MPLDNIPKIWHQIARRDIASIAIHWTKTKIAVSDDNFISTEPQPEKTALDILYDILKASCLLGNNGYIKGGHKCVCFTEAPLTEMVAMFAIAALDTNEYSLKYKPFGVGVSKEWLFNKGGRPVIYQPDNEYDQLPEYFQWRHCRYEPPKIDFTWEREWRISVEKLEICSSQTWIFVPTSEIAQNIAVKFPKWRVMPLDLIGLPDINYLNMK